MKLILTLWMAVACVHLSAHPSAVPLQSVSGTADAIAPRVLPKEQAAHFCRLLVSDGESKVYPLSTYAQHLATLLCGQPSYGDYTAEQVFTGIIFYYDDWIREPFILTASADRQQLVYELHSGATLRIFPHKSGNTVSWYSPTGTIPASVDTEHRRYMQEVFTHLNTEVQAEDWETVAAYIDRMIQYQCQYGGTKQAQSPSPIALIFLILLPAVIALINPRQPKSGSCATA